MASSRGVQSRRISISSSGKLDQGAPLAVLCCAAVSSSRHYGFVPQAERFLKAPISTEPTGTRPHGRTFRGMPLYSFHIDALKPHVDTTGEELPDDDRAWASALRMLQDVGGGFAPGDEWTLKIYRGKTTSSRRGHLASTWLTKHYKQPRRSNIFPPITDAALARAALGRHRRRLRHAKSPAAYRGHRAMRQYRFVFAMLTGCMDRIGPSVRMPTKRHGFARNVAIRSQRSMVQLGPPSSPFITRLIGGDVAVLPRPH